MHHHNINVCIYNLFILVLNSIMLYMGISNALSKNCLSFVKLGAKYRVQISLCKQGLLNMLYISIIEDLILCTFIIITND